MNIFASDFYRLRKGAALRNTLIGLVITIAFLGGTFFTMTSNGFQVFIDETASAQGVSEREVNEIRDDFAEFDDYAPENTASFTREMVGTNLLTFFFLPLIISIFCADFNNATFRNTLSYESSRSRVYLEKLLLSACACLTLNLANVIISLVIGGVLFGFGGLSTAFFLDLLVTCLLLLPVQLGTIGFGYCLVAFFKKSSSVIAIYLIALTVLTSIIQMASLLPGLGWLSLLDWNAVGKLLVNYRAMPAVEIAIAVVSGLLVAAVTTAAGLLHYRKADMA